CHGRHLCSAHEAGHDGAAADHPLKGACHRRHHCQRGMDQLVPLLLDGCWAAAVPPVAGAAATREGVVMSKPEDELEFINVVEHGAGSQS
ncbi:unnamed protein product, partial [Pylaiella littoralis]